MLCLLFRCLPSWSRRLTEICLVQYTVWLAHVLTRKWFRLRHNFLNGPTRSQVMNHIIATSDTRSEE